MPTFQYATRNNGPLKTLEAPDEKTALQMAAGMKDADPRTGVSIVKSPTPDPTTPPQNQVMDKTGAMDATDLGYGSPKNMPTPTAPGTQTTYQTGLGASVAAAETKLTDTMKAERDAALKRTDELTARLTEIQKEQDPTKRATWDQEQRVIQNQLNAAETASASLEKDFTKRRSVVSELSKLLTEGNTLIEQSKVSPVALSVLGKGVNRTIQDVQARAGVLEAVITGLDGNMSGAHSIINNARLAVAASWEDTLAYNQAYLKLVGDGELEKDKIHDDYAQAQVDLAKDKLDSLQKTSDYLQELMISPESAQFLADAGVTLNDSIDEVKEKMAKQAKVEEVQDTINELKLEGYKNVPYAEGRTDVVELEIGDQKLYFIPPPSVLDDWNDTGDGDGGGTGNQLEFSLAEAYVAENLGKLSEEEIRADLLKNSKLTATDIDSIIAAGKKKQGETKGVPTGDEVYTQVKEKLGTMANSYSRSEAKDLATAQLKKAMGISESGSLPKAYKTAIDDALTDVYGATFWENLWPGGRGAW